MAATSTNKQPLLVDRVLHYVVNLDTSINDGMDIVGTNTATLLIDGTTSDGAIVEDIYTIARGTTEYKVNLYISSARDYLRPNEAVFVGVGKRCKTLVPAPQCYRAFYCKGDVVRWEEMPSCEKQDVIGVCLMLLSFVGVTAEALAEACNRAFYLPKGYALWAARESTANVGTDGPCFCY